jgi:hypothetical protein
MLKKTFAFFLLAFLCSPSFAAHRHSAERATASEHVGEWVASGGIGLTIAPTLFLLSPQLEYVVKPHILVGPLVQLGISDWVLFTGGISGRILIGHHPRVKPCLEGGLGIAVASANYASSVGVNIHFGIGMDYQVDPDIAIGTIIRANFAPPLKTFYLSWPILMGRFTL